MKLFNHITIAILFSLMVLQLSLNSCTNSYNQESFVGIWHDTNDSIILDLRSDSTFMMTLKPHTSSTINQLSDTIRSITGKWSIEEKDIHIIYQDDFSNSLNDDAFEIYDMVFYNELLYWKDGMAEFFILKRKD